MGEYDVEDAGFCFDETCHASLLAWDAMRDASGEKVLGDLLGGETESVKRGIKLPFLIARPVE
jgi:hypothetical protein